MDDKKEKPLKKIKIASFWENKDKNGNTYLNGYLNGCPLVIFKDTYKQPGDKRPDYNAYIFPWKERKDDVRDKSKDDFSY